MRVVSLLPAATELLYAIDVEPVGVTHACSYPPAASNRPTVLETTIDAAADSTTIDEQVRTADEPPFDLDTDALESLDPDLLIAQGVCEVCAVDVAWVRSEMQDCATDPEILTADPHRLEDVFALLEQLGERLDRDRRASEVTQSLRRRVDAVERSIPSSGPRVVVLDWLDPVMVAGHWVPDLVGIAGGEYGLADPGADSRPREWSTIREYDPEVLLIAPCGLDVAQARQDLHTVTGREGWSELAAVGSGDVYLLDGDSHFNCPGPRLVDTLEQLAGLIHDTDAPTDGVVRVGRERIT